MMKKIIFLTLLTLFCSPAFAKVLIVNENDVNDMDVSYRFCQAFKSPASCSAIQTVKVKAGDSKTAVELLIPADSDMVLITSAAEKDSSGKVIAQGDYQIGDNRSHCGYPIVTEGTPNNVVVSLSDLKQSSSIRCLANGY
jgi:hypothetical protein